MKVLTKDKLMARNLIKYAITERNVLSYIKHPFIVGLNYAFQTAEKLFLILDYCPNGDLAAILGREGRITEDRARIYLCQILLAIEELHRLDVIYRDLKPDNIVLDAEGNCQLTDFGLSKEGVDENNYA
jgi:serine/threonine protein kinase